MQPQVRLDRQLPEQGAQIVLDESQLRVVAHRGEPLLVLAGPGTGKTTTLVEAMAQHLAERPGEQVLGLTFGRRAAADWRARVARRRPSGPVPEILTFHAFAYAIVRALAPAEPYRPTPRIASAGEQLAQVRELLREPVRDHGWPPDWDAARTTVGFARSLVDMINTGRAVDAGLSSDAATAAAISSFLDEYLAISDSRGLIDFVELIEQAEQLVASPAADKLRATYRAIYVDEFQDTDSASQRLLAALVAPGTTLVVVGDPDQSIYSFRGADRAGILEFPQRFPTVGGTPQVALTRNRRFGTQIQQAALRVLRDAALPGLSADTVRAHRQPTCEGNGTVRVVTYDSTGAEAAHIAELLRREHLTGERLGWDQMAVLVRNTDQLAPIGRALALAGVPADVLGDEVPLAQEPAALTALMALDTASRLDSLDFEELEQLLLGPLGGVDPVELRRFRRELRARVRELQPEVTPTPDSAVLLVELFDDPAELGGFDGPVPAAMRELRATLTAISGATGPHSALSALWRSSDWARRLQRDSSLGGQRGRLADHDLDVLVALFEAAARAEESVAGHKGVAAFRADLMAVEIPATTGRSSTEPRVQLLTAHRAKGLEWELVVVAGMQEGVWPGLGSRSRLFAGREVDPAALLAEERRLAFVAATRARGTLVVTAVDASEERPSRFLTDFAGGGESLRVVGRPTESTSLPGLVAELREASESGEPGIANEAASRLASLAAELGADGSQLVPSADPATWWGVNPYTESGATVRPPGPVKLSASSLSRFVECPQRFFLEHEAGGTVSRTRQMGFGSVIHAVAAAIVTGELPAELGAIDSELDRWWPSLGYETRWEAAAARRDASAAVAALLRWHVGRDPIAAEAGFDLTFEVGADEVRLTGSIDRLDRDVTGRTVVADFKTASTADSAAEAAANLQLALYQYVVARGAVAGAEDPGGAELVFLRVPLSGGDPTVRQQLPIDSNPELDIAGFEDVMSGVTGLIRGETFPARPAVATCRNCAVAAACPAVPAGLEVAT